MERFRKVLSIFAQTSVFSVTGYLVGHGRKYGVIKKRRIMLLKKKLFLWVIVCCVRLSASAVGLSAYALLCEQMENPVGMDCLHPRFSWKLKASERNCFQKSYRILVASSPDLLDKGKADIWDSGNVVSGNSVLVPYGGKALEAARTYYWKVRVKDKGGNVSPWSAVQHFTTGLFAGKDWENSEWIAFEPDGDILVPALSAPSDRWTLGNKPVGRHVLPMFRKNFHVKENPVEKAVAYVSGLGHFDFFLNGEKVGDHFLDPGWTKYDKEALYVAFDVTKLLREGENAIGVMLGNGFYNIPNERYYKLTGSFGSPKLRMKLFVYYADGTKQSICTDETWKVAESPVVFSSIFGGEDYDARKKQEGWCEPGFDDHAWKEALTVKSDVVLRAQSGTHLGVRNILPVVTRYKNSRGFWVYDFGQNFSGIVRLRVKGKCGSEVLLRPAELLNADSTANQSASGDPFYFKYILAGTGQVEGWQPQFTYYGFRYIQVEGAVPEGVDNPEELPEIVGIEGGHTCNQAEENGTFVCSNPMFNKIYNLIDWAMRSNMASVLTDCPHREKLGWQEEAHLMQYSLQYRYNLSSLYPKILNDLAASQLDNGAVPSISPEYVRFAGGFEDSPEWGSSLVVCPWYVFLWYGDRRLLEENYPRMKKYVEYLGTRADNHIVAYGLGDWYDLGPNAPGYAQLTSNGVTATAMYYYDTVILQKVATELGYDEDVSYYSSLADSIKLAYNRKYYHQEEGYYDRNSQTANAVSLFMGLVEDSERSRVTENLVRDIRQRGNALTAGDVGYRYVLRALEDAGRTDVIFEMNNRYDVPGYGWQLAHGATALTESWQAYGFVSNNHFMLGHLMEWFFSGVGGIRMQNDAVAFNRILIRPQVVGDISSATTSYESSYGRVTCDWKVKGRDYYLRVQVPANTEAEVFLPAKKIQQVTDYGVPLTDRKEMDCRIKDDGLWVKIGSGNYFFRVENFIFPN